MRRRSWLWTILLIVACLAVVVAGLGTALKQEPAFYMNPAMTHPQPDDPTRASETLTRLSDLKKAAEGTGPAEPEWGGRFTAEDLNAFFREDPATNNLVEPQLGGLTAPRVSIEGDRLLVAARYGSGFWSTVVSVELRAWVIADEPNLFAIELVSLNAGVLPLTKRWFMERLNTFTNNHTLSISWFRNGDRPVAVCRWMPHQSRPTNLLRTIAIGNGQLEIAGRNLSSR
jgi:hypothetical protein